MFDKNKKPKYDIGFDLSFVRPDYKNGGIEAYAKNLMHGFEELGLSDKIVYLIHRDIYKNYKEEFRTSKFIIYNSGLSHKFRMLLFQTFSIPKIVKRYGIKVVFEPTYTSGIFPFSRHIVVSNPHDLQHKYYPHNFSITRKLYINTTSLLTFIKSKYVIAISKYVNSTFQECYPVILKNKTQIIYNPIRFIDELPDSINGINGKFILSINALRKNKNIITLLKAYKLISREVEEKLVIVGIKQDDTHNIMNFIKNNDLTDDVIIKSFLSDEQLGWLYKNASVFVSTSLYEGFGMTPVEAMGYGCPTISSKDTSLYESTRGLAVYYEPTMDEKQLASKILDVLSGKIIVDTEKNKTIIRELYDYKKVSKEYYDFFCSIANECHSSGE